MAEYNIKNFKYYGKPIKKVNGKPVKNIFYKGNIYHIILEPSSLADK